MSIETWTRLSRLAALAGIAACGLSPSFAAETIFRPSVSFGVAHDGNVRIVDFDPATQATAQKEGDEYARLGVDLAVDWKTRSSAMSFSYRPEYVKYRNRSDLDFFGNTLVFGYTRQPSLRSKTAVNVDLARTDSQGVTLVNVSRANTFVPRTTLTRAHVVGGGSVASGARTFWDWQVRASADRYKAVTNVIFQDSNTAGITGGWRHGLSERSTLGLAASLDGFDYTTVPSGAPVSALPSVLVESLGVAGTFAISRVTLLTYGVGAAHSTSNGNSATNGSFSVTIAREIAEVSHLNAGISQGITPGSGTSGATLDSGAWVGYVLATSRRGLTSSVYAAYWHRAGLDVGPAAGTSTNTGSVAGTVGWNFNRFIAVHAGYSLNYQPHTTITVQDPVTQVPTERSVPSSTYGSYGLYLRWAIAGR